MKKFVLIMGLILEADPLNNNFNTLIRTVENVVEGDNIFELESMGQTYLSRGGHSYKILTNNYEHEGVVWSNKAVTQFNNLMYNNSLSDFKLD